MPMDVLSHREENCFSYSRKIGSYQKFVAIKEIPNIVQAEIAAWGDSTGGGFQYELPYNIKKLKELGYIREIN